MDSAAHVVLAAIAGRTVRIRLGTAVTVLSTQDPVRLYTDFATLDAVSNALVLSVLDRSNTAYDFQRLRRARDIRAAPLLAASIFLDVLNVFLLRLSIFGREG
jgi:Luciferase-like monooxygenase